MAEAGELAHWEILATLNETAKDRGATATEYALLVAFIAAVIAVTISARGVVEDPTVKSATDPAFGDAALVAIKDWRFLPKVMEGHGVVSRADVPFIFTPPKAGGGT